MNLPDLDSMERISGQKARKKALVKRRRKLTWLSFYMVWLLLLCAVASPILIGKPEMEVKTSRNFLILADLSFSMAQRDWYMDGQRVRRWDAVKAVMNDFIEKREGDRMGVIFFASNAYIQVPFSSDLKVVGELMDEADVGMAGQMTNIGKAMIKGKELFDRDTLKTKVALLFTDGVDSGTDILPLDAADLLAKDSIKVYTIGIGDPNARDSDLDENTLREIARLTKASYFNASDTDVLEQVTTALNTLEPIEYKEAKYKPKTQLYFYPASLAILFALVISLILGLNSLNNKKKYKS
ncbi:VWA domain-containing protein [Flavobacteriaceae bacterium]|nr:VWA domain-containing protein [Flavobacteriaceae bacterium]